MFHPSLVHTLFSSGCPANIARFVVTVVISTIYRKFWVRARSYIDSKFFKIIPAFANFYSSTAIIFKLLIVWIVATIAQIFPDRIERVFSMFFVSSIFVNWMRAFARTNFALSEVYGGSDVLAPAITLAQPSSMIVNGVRVNALDRDQSTKTSTRDIFEIGHRAGPIGSWSSGGFGVSAPTRCAL